jgi:hypothetical protein
MARRFLLVATSALVASVLVPAGVGADGYWRQCGRVLPEQKITVVAHDVECAKAREIIHRTYSKGQEVPPGQKFVRVFGFKCVIRNDAYRMVSCRRGEQRVLGPLPS